MATDRAFNLVVCTGYTAGQGLSVLHELRATIRCCPHGVLVLLQPCTTDRAPLAQATWVGPIDSREDAADLCDWVERGDWNLDSLPRHLRPGMNRMRQVGSRN